MPKPRPGEVLFRVRVRGAIPRPGKHPHDVDRRYKRLTDPDTGEVLREESGRLSDHHGHGSAKRR